MGCKKDGKGGGSFSINQNREYIINKINEAKNKKKALVRELASKESKLADIKNSPKDLLIETLKPSSLFSATKNVVSGAINKYKNSKLNDNVSDYMANTMTNKRGYDMLAEMNKNKANKLKIKRENPGIPDSILNKQK